MGAIMETCMTFGSLAGPYNELCSHWISLSPTLLLPILRGVRGIKVTGTCFHMSGLRKSLLMVVMLMMVIQLPQNETFDQEQGRVVVSHGLQRSFSPSHVGHILHCGSVLGIVDVYQNPWLYPPNASGRPPQS